MKNKKVALIRGNSLNTWEGQAWNGLSGWDVTGVCAKHNLYPLAGIEYPIVSLPAVTDWKIWHKFEQIVSARQQRMIGLEKILSSVTIAHTAEIYYYYTQQAVRAKGLNPGLKVVTTVWDNSFARFEGSQWPGLGKMPAWWRRQIQQIIKANVVGVNHFLPVSQSAAELLTSYGVPEQKITVLTPAVVDQPVVQNELVNSVLADARPFWLVINRLVPEKGTADVISAWAQYQGRGTEQLVIVGQGPELVALQAQVALLGLVDSVRFIPNIPNNALALLYKSAQALLLASRPTVLWEEQFGFVLAEAIKAGCPVIATRTGAIPEVVGNAGIIVSPQTPTEITLAMNLVSQPEKRDLLKNALAVQAQRFTVARFQKELVTIYDSLL